MLKRFLIAAVASMIAASAFAVSSDQVVQSIELKDGSIVHIFKDGKMAMESRFGSAVRMHDSEVMEARDGRKIIMSGDEVARLDGILRTEYRGAR